MWSQPFLSQMLCFQEHYRWGDPPHGQRGCEGQKLPAFQLWSRTVLWFLAALVLGQHNSTFLFPHETMQTGWVRPQGMQYWSRGSKCARPRSTCVSYTAWWRAAINSTAVQASTLDTKANINARVNWRTEGPFHWCNNWQSDSEANLPAVSLQYHLSLMTRGYCNKPSKGLCANTREGISLSQKEQMSFVTNGNGFSAQT